ncbi:MAG: glycosyltransferase [Cyclobacteriaceae bacterium]
MPGFSVIVPVFKREDEVLELLDSLDKQSYSDFEVIIVDGSPTDDLKSVEKYASAHYSKLKFQRIYIKGLGISDSRNLGAKQACGEYLIFMDSDVIVPEGYFEKVEKSIKEQQLIAFGGPDAAHKSFSDVQKAISFSMTSVLTTGGIRGKKNHVGKYKPRGFNMGVKTSVFRDLRGFNAALPVGEDMDLSARIIAAGHKTELIPEAFVYHKRRVSILKFYKQVYRFGAARVMLSRLHEDELKITHLFPLAFTLYLLGGVFSLFLPFEIVRVWPLSILVYCILLFRGAVLESRSFKVGLLSVPVTVTQFYAYARGFIANGYAVWVLGKPKGIFEKKEGEPESPL